MLIRPLALAAVLALAGVTSALAESSTIRVEPRPYYGAVVTLEQGVRVWRPLPPTRHMIINPTNAPIAINVTDVRETVNHTGYPYGAGATASASARAGGGYGALPWYYAGSPHAARGRAVPRRAIGHRRAHR